MSNADKENIMADALSTAEGRAALSAAMVEPLKVALNYQGIGRSLLQTAWAKKIMDIEPMFEIEDYIDDAHCPEWKVTFWDEEDNYIVRAPDGNSAIYKAQEIKDGKPVN